MKGFNFFMILPFLFIFSCNLKQKIPEEESIAKKTSTIEGKGIDKKTPTIEEKIKIPYPGEKALQEEFLPYRKEIKSFGNSVRLFLKEEKKYSKLPINWNPLFHQEGNLELVDYISIDEKTGDVLFKNRKTGNIIRGFDQYHAFMLDKSDKYLKENEPLVIRYGPFFNKGLYPYIILKNRGEREKAKRILRGNYR